MVERSHSGYAAARLPADGRGRGESYGTGVYDAIASRALAHVTANAALIAEVEDAIADRVAPSPDQFALARIRREREQATRRLVEDGNVDTWKATMERLDREEAEAHAAAAPRLTSREVARSLADLGRLFADAEPVTRHRIV